MNLILFSKIKNSSFFKNSVAYSGTNAIEQFLTIIRGFAVRSMLSPEIMGFYNFMTVVQGFLSTFDIGVISGATRELPIVEARGESAEKEKIQSTTVWFMVLQNVVISAAAVCYIYWHRGGYATSEIIAASAGIGVFLLSSLYIIYGTFIITSQSFVLLGKLSLTCAIFDTAGFIVCTHIWGLYGLLTVSVVSVVIRSAFFLFGGRWIGVHIRPKIFLATLKSLLSFGFFVKIVDYPNALFSMLSILWVTKFMNVEALALFSMARGFALQAVDISTRVGTVYAMQFLQQVGSGTPKDVIGKQLKKYLLFQLLVIVPLLSLAALFGLTFIVNHFTPQYTAANEAFLILLLSGFFYVLNSGLTNLWMAEKQLIRRGAANLFGLSAMAGTIAVQWFILERRTINDIAWSSVIGSYFYFVYMVIAVGKNYWKNRECLDIIVSVTAVALWTFCVLYVGFKYSGSDTHSLVSAVGRFLLVSALSLVALLPAVFFGVKKSRILSV
ncbi:MAG: hypothetical protein PH343_00460 [Nitrospira sp.]|nr:hypothetical protein [Nitrospira sp.]